MTEPNNSTPDRDQGQSDSTLDLNKILYELQKWDVVQGVWEKYGPPILGRDDANTILNRQKESFPMELWRALPKTVCDHYREALKHARNALLRQRQSPPHSRHVG